MLPMAPANYAQERRGISAVAAVAANLGQIWRETPTGDVGIDGQLEFVDASGCATGKTVAVQVKSGPSYLKGEDSRTYAFYPEGKHRTYWERYPLPVLLMLHDTDSGQTYWTDARQHLRNRTGPRPQPFPFQGQMCCRRRHRLNFSRPLGSLGMRSSPIWKKS